MLRRVPRIALCLLAGALLTIATAWSFAIFAPRPAQAITNDNPTAWPVPVPENWTPPESDETARGFGLSLHTTTARSEVPFRPWPGYIRKHYIAKVVTTGWPCRALYCEDRHGFWSNFILSSPSVFNFAAEPLQPVSFSADAWQVPDWIERHIADPQSMDYSGNADRIPHHIIPRGFILNTLFYAAAVYALFSLVLFIRSTYRRRQHHCPACNYPLTGLPQNSPCPECGRARPAP